MELTSRQAAELLGIDAARPEEKMRKLVDSKRITPLYPQKEGTKRYYMKFDSRAVKELKKALTDEGVPTVSRKRPVRKGELADLLTWASLDKVKRAVLVKLGERFTAEELELLLNL